jgi:predicted SnoaL-like aldol condensation-catalyzing enzyme
VDDAKSVMRKMVEIFATGNLETLDSVVSTAYVDHQGLGDLEVRGPEGFRRLVMAVRAPHKKDVWVRIEDLIGEGDGAAARLRWHHRKADGTVVERETINIIRSMDGQAVEHWGADASQPLGD